MATTKREAKREALDKLVALSGKSATDEYVGD